MYIQTQIWYKLTLVKYETSKVSMFTEKLQNDPLSNTPQHTKYVFDDMCAIYNVLLSTLRQKYCIINMYIPIIKTKSSR